MIYTIRNTGTSQMQWRIQPSVSWIGLTSTTGTLMPNMSANVVISMNMSASVLPVGSYSGSLAFTNLTNNQGNTTRPIYLVVTPTTGSAVMLVSPTTAMVFSGPVGGPFGFNA